MPVVFPLYPVLADGSCGCKIPGCSRYGKHPAVKFGELQQGADDRTRVEVDGVLGGAGFKTGAGPKGSGVVVVDIDSREAAEAWDNLGGHSEPTTTVETSRGIQLYFQHPGFYVKNSRSELAPKIDVRGDGGYAVMPGSTHVSGALYRTVNPGVEPAPCPAWLVEWFKKQPARAEVQPSPDDITDPVERERRRKIYRTHLETCDPCVAGRGGDETLFNVVQYGAYDLALPTEDVLELIEDVFDPRCEPPWGAELEGRVVHKAHYAKIKSTRDRRIPLSAAEEAILSEQFPPQFPAEKSMGTAGTDLFDVRWGGWSDVPLPPAWLISDLVARNKINMIYADPGSIKTWVAISMAIAVASGEPWLGEMPVEQGKVVYIDFEDGRDEFHRRVHMLSKGQSLPELGYLYGGRAGRLDDAAFWEKLEKFQKPNNVQFFVVDTLAAGTPGIDENSREAADALIYAGRFAEATPATLLVLHHSNKSGDIRGTSAFKASVDTLFKLQKTIEKEGEDFAKLSCVKSGQKKVRPVEMRLTDANGIEFVREEEKPSESQSESEEDKKDKRSVEELRAEILLLIEQRGPFASHDAIRMATSARKSSVSAVMAELAAAGDIAKLPEGWIRDNEKLRRERMREAIQTNPSATRTKLIALASVTRDQFDRFLALGNIRPISPDPSVPGFIWSEQ